MAKPPTGKKISTKKVDSTPTKSRGTKEISKKVDQDNMSGPSSKVPSPRSKSSPAKVSNREMLAPAELPEKPPLSRSPKSKSSPRKPSRKSFLPLPTAPIAALPEAELETYEETLDVLSSSTAPTAGSDEERMRILFISSECTPLAQTGGLGDAVAGLAKALYHRGHDVRIVMPLYRSIDRYRFNIQYTHPCCVHFGQGEEIWVGIHNGRLDDLVPIWFIEYERYFGRHGGIYDEPHGPDNCYRFGVLSKAALQIAKDSFFTPHVVHVHDWMSAMSSVFLKTWDRVLSPLSQTASVITIHNLGYQGKFPPNVMSFYGLGGEHFHPQAFEDFGNINLLKAGIQYSDAITTVSPTYAREILSPIGGQGLAPYLNARQGDLFGILNGVDTSVWNPETDPYLPARYSRYDLSGKAVCKKALQERFHLEVNPRIPIFGIVSRFASQKGFDLIRGALPQALRDMAIQVVCVGSGDPLTESFFRWMSHAYPGKACAHIGFSADLAHLIEAGSDFFLMPSIYEPCGLNQMYSSLYGTLPLVRATGGLDDTVDNYDENSGKGTGFKFWDINDRALYYTIGWANATWWDRPHHYAAMQREGMSRDFTWNTSARQYEEVYRHAIVKRRALV